MADVIEYVAPILSLLATLCLVAAVVTLSIFPDLRNSSGSILIIVTCATFAVFSAVNVFAYNSEQFWANNIRACQTFSIILLFSLLSSSLWTIVLGSLLYRLHVVGSHDVWKKMKFTLTNIVVWGTTLTLTALLFFFAAQPRVSQPPSTESVSFFQLCLQLGSYELIVLSLCSMGVVGMNSVFVSKLLLTSVKYNYQLGLPRRDLKVFYWICGGVTLSLVGMVIELANFAAPWVSPLASASALLGIGSAAGGSFYFVCCNKKVAALWCQCTPCVQEVSEQIEGVFSLGESEFDRGTSMGTGVGLMSHAYR